MATLLAVYYAGSGADLPDWFLTLIIGAVLLSYVLDYFKPFAANAITQEALKAGVRVTHVAVDRRYSVPRRGTNIVYTVRGSVIGSQDVVKGTATVSGRVAGTVDLAWDWETRQRDPMGEPPVEDIIATAEAKAAAEANSDETAQFEARVRDEVNSRLDALQTDREAFLANDKNHDGMIDGDEWAQVRGRIEAEVRAELSPAADAAAVDEDSAEAQPTDAVW